MELLIQWLYHHNISVLKNTVETVAHIVEIDISSFFVYGCKGERASADFLFIAL